MSNNVPPTEDPEVMAIARAMARRVALLDRAGLTNQAEHTRQALARFSERHGLGPDASDLGEPSPQEIYAAREVARAGLDALRILRVGNRDAARSVLAHWDRFAELRPSEVDLICRSFPPAGPAPIPSGVDGHRIGQRHPSA